MRTVTSWIGKTDDAPVPAAVRARIFARHNGKCATTGRKLRAGEWDLDHIIPLALGGTHSETNLQPVWRPAHREKSSADMATIAKARRQHLKHIGAWEKSKRPLRSRGFPKGRNAAFTETDPDT